MCIVALAWQLFADKSVVLLSNRDEFFARPTKALYQWQDLPIVAGRDEQSGGTWLGINPNNGRFATVLNFRESNAIAGNISRGQLVVDFLTGNISPLQFVRAINLQNYAGFNLLVGTREQAVIVNNRGYTPTPLASGLYVLSNGMPDSAWFKTERLRGRVRQEVLPLIAQAHLNKRLSNEQQTWQRIAFQVLSDTTPAQITELPDTGIDKNLEQSLSSISIDLPQILPMYGTRVSSLLTLSQTGYDFIELDKKTLKKIHLHG